MNRTVLQRRAAEALRHDLEPGEHIAAGSALNSDPPRWGVAALLTLSVALTATGLMSLLGPLPTEPAAAIGLPVLGLGSLFLPRPMYVVATGQRLICLQMSRLSSTPGRLAFAAPLADLRILNYRSGNYGTSIRCQFPGRKPVLLHASRARRKDFAEVVTVLARSGAFAGIDPPYPSAENLATAAYRR